MEIVLNLNDFLFLCYCTGKYHIGAVFIFFWIEGRSFWYFTIPTLAVINYKFCTALSPINLYFHFCCISVLSHCNIFFHFLFCVFLSKIERSIEFSTGSGFCEIFLSLIISSHIYSSEGNIGY